MSRTSSLSRPEGGASLMVAWRLVGRRVLVVGGGEIAASRVLSVLEADGQVTLVAPKLCSELRLRHRRGELRWQKRPFESSDLNGAAMVLVAIDDHEESERIALSARACAVPVNVADNVALCDFWFPSVHREGSLQIAVTSNGKAPAMSARLRRLVAASLPEGIGEAIDRFGDLRRRIGERDTAPLGDRRRMSWLSEIGRQWPISRLASMSEGTRDRLIDSFFNGEPAPENKPRQPSSIKLVGAGPGDPNLLTVAAHRAIEEADLVVADRLCSPSILALVKGELKVARKTPGRAAEAQEELNGWVLAGAKANKRVVRLKCGDPFIFGRGGEELQWLMARGFEAEVLPGISSALAAPLSADIPLTHRGLANRLTLMSAVAKGGAPLPVPEFDLNTTLVILMGVRRLPELALEMSERGYPGDLPVTIIERGCRPEERITAGNLKTISAQAQARQIVAPAIIVVGNVAAFSRSQERCWERIEEAS